MTVIYLFFFFPLQSIGTLICKHTEGNAETVHGKTYQPANDGTSVFAVHESDRELTMLRSSSHSTARLWQVESYLARSKIYANQFVRD